MTERHIVGMGGGGFHTEPENPLLDDFVLSLSRRSPARICLVPTASGDYRELIIRFYRAFSGRAIATDLTLLGSPQLPTNPPRSTQLESFVLEQDIIYVSGGNAVNMLALWRAHGLDRVLRKAWEQGVVMAGMSAGLICWFEEFIDSSLTGKPTRMRDGLGMLKGSASPHYDVAPARRAGYRSLVEQGLAEGYGVDESAALHFQGTEFVEAVCSRPDAAAYRIARGADGQVAEEKVPTRFLGTP
jgi:dipeptidase E